ncbi:hypothetical protein [Algicola sagamiensis]|uniref:hypothetical protein n=1 Tax=Algicola sagamiensis TaxID=163869 RepID=UPI00035C9634|nr:hypothetical protein [Algicola sagamiensis]
MSILTENMYQEAKEKMDALVDIARNKTISKADALHSAANICHIYGESLNEQRRCDLEHDFDEIAAQIENL